MYSADEDVSAPADLVCAVVSAPQNHHDPLHRARQKTRWCAQQEERRGLGGGMGTLCGMMSRKKSSRGGTAGWMARGGWHTFSATRLRRASNSASGILPCAAARGDRCEFSMGNESSTVSIEKEMGEGGEFVGRWRMPQCRAMRRPALDIVSAIETLIVPLARITPALSRSKAMDQH